MKKFMKTSKNGITMNGVSYKTIILADDIAFLRNNKEELQNALHQMNKILKNKNDMTKDKENQSCETFLREEQKAEMFLDGRRVVKVDTHKYLESCIT